MFDHFTLLVINVDTDIVGSDFYSLSNSSAFWFGSLFLSLVITLFSHQKQNLELNIILILPVETETPVHLQPHCHFTVTHKHKHFNIFPYSIINLTYNPFQNPLPNKASHLFRISVKLSSERETKVPKKHR